LQELQTTIAQLMQQQKEIDALKLELKQQSAFIQEVSNKVEISGPAQQMVSKDN
jgi:hypothetical protein